jgi:hypothetical protein
MVEYNVHPQAAIQPLDKLATALAKAQGEFPAVRKSGTNPHLRNEYVTLDDIIAAVRAPLAQHGLSFVQLLNSNNGDGALTLRTVLLHESGQFLEAQVRVDAADSRGINALQSIGAAITYMKRYSLAAMLGIAADVDTDGAGVVSPTTTTPAANKCPVCAATGAHHAPWCQERDGARVDARNQPGHGPSWETPAADAGEPEPMPEPEPAPKPAPVQANGGKAKPASIKSREWTEAGKRLAAEEPYYQASNGSPNWHHMTGAAAKLGHATITDANLADVIADLAQYAQDQQALAGGDKAPGDDLDAFFGEKPEPAAKAEPAAPSDEDELPF